MRFDSKLAKEYALLLCAAMAACTVDTPLSAAAKEVERELAWVERANASSMYQADVAAGRQRFLAVCGYACMVPGVGSLTADLCFPRVAVEQIKGTSDVRLSERHSTLIAQAWDVATKYNKLVAEGLSQQGRSSCPSNANFDAAFGDLRALVEAAHSSASERSLSMAAHEPVFRLVLPPEKLTFSFEQAACGILSKHSLPSEVSLIVSFEPTSGMADRIVRCKSAT